MNAMTSEFPSLSVREITDLYVQKNFRALQDYFNQQNQLLNFNFIEWNFTAAVTNQKIAHGLNCVPQDVIVTRLTGKGTPTLNWGLFDATSLDITTTGACRIRMFVGNYWNFQSSLGSNTTDTQDYSAFAKATTTTTTTSTVTSTTTATVTARPTITQFAAAGSFTFAPKYVFIISSGSATSGATYVINGVTYTVDQTVASETQIVLSGLAVPPSSGVLVSGGVGTGDPYLTYTSVLSPLYMDVEVVGGGGGGSGAGPAGASNGTAGTASSFAATLLVANGGGLGTWNTSGGAGGTTSIGTGVVELFRNAGGGGQGGGATVAAGSRFSEGEGGDTPFYGGGGKNMYYATAGATGSAPGAGGGGGGNAAVAGSIAGSGGGSGGYCRGLIFGTNLATVLAGGAAIVVGSAGSAGAGAGGGNAGGPGAVGLVIVKMFYQ